MDEYEKLLNRAIDQLPPEVFENKRFKIPKAYSDIQGNRTFIKNFKDVAEGLNRDPQQRPSTFIKIFIKRIRYCRKLRRWKSNLTR